MRLTEAASRSDMLRKKGKVLTPKRKLKVVTSKVYVNKECDDKNCNLSKMHWQFVLVITMLTNFLSKSFKPFPSF